MAGELLRQSYEHLACLAVVLYDIYIYIIYIIYFNDFDLKKNHKKIITRKVHIKLCKMLL